MVRRQRLGDLVSKENQDGLLVGTRKKVKKLILMIFPINELKETDSYSATAGVNVVPLNSLSGTWIWNSAVYFFNSFQHLC